MPSSLLNNTLTSTFIDTEGIHNNHYKSYGGIACMNKAYFLLIETFPFSNPLHALATIQQHHHKQPDRVGDR